MPKYQFEVNCVLNGSMVHQGGEEEEIYMHQQDRTDH